MIGETQLQAIVENLSRSVVFVLNPSPEDPYTGTAVLVRFRSQRYLVSALHNFDKYKSGNIDTVVSAWTRTRFQFRDEGPLNFVDGREHVVPALSKGIELPLDTKPLIDRKFDLVAVRVTDRAVMSDPVSSVDLDKSAFSDIITDGATLITVGMPSANAIKLPKNSKVFNSYTFWSSYKADATLPSHYRFEAEDQFLYSYSPGATMHPGGFSGAPVWANADLTGPIWSPAPVMVGLVLEYFKDFHLIKASKMKNIIGLLKKDPLVNLDDNGLEKTPVSSERGATP
jgi:hypothetical protein